MRHAQALTHHIIPAWCTNHSEIHNNERADELANSVITLLGPGISLEESSTAELGDFELGAHPAHAVCLNVYEDHRHIPEEASPCIYPQTS